MNEKIKTHHLNRNAVLYVRQSSTFQVTHNEESRRLQYAMKQRIRELGWQEVNGIDEDLGLFLANSKLAVICVHASKTNCRNPSIF